MTRPAAYPLFARDRTAARLLDMPVGRFRELVDKGILPPPVPVDGDERWDVEKLTKALRGERLHEERPKW